MKINDKEINVDQLVNNLKTDFHKDYNGIPLNNAEKNILKNNGFNIEHYNNIDELIFDIEKYLNDVEDNDELNYVLNELSEFNYYHNAKK